MTLKEKGAHKEGGKKEDDEMRRLIVQLMLRHGHHQLDYGFTSTDRQ